MGVIDWYWRRYGQKKQLFIRACKSADAQKRVRSVHRRFYLTLGSENENKIAICGILTGIVDKYCPMTSSELINEMGPARDWLHTDGDYYDRAINVLIFKIRLTEVSSFSGLTPPMIFRKTH